MARTSSAREGPSPTTTSEAPATRLSAETASGRFFCGVSRPANTKVGNPKPSRSRSSAGEAVPSIDGAGLGTTRTRSGGTPQPYAISAR